MHRPVYGLMVLIKHIPESLSSFKEDNISISKSNIYFSNQVLTWTRIYMCIYIYIESHTLE